MKPQGTEEYSVFSKKTINSVIPIQTRIRKVFHSKGFCFRRNKEFFCKKA